MAIRFGSDLCADPVAAGQREWLISNGLGSYGSGTVAGPRTRSYHGLLVAALGAPADPCTRTLLVAGLEEGPALNQRSMVAFTLEGSVPCWRYAIGDALLEKRLWMQPGAHTTTVHYRLLQASRPLELQIAVLVHARSHHGYSQEPTIDLRAVPRGVQLRPDVAGVPPFVVLSDRGRTELAAPGDWGEVALSAERERGLPSHDRPLRACRITVALSSEAPTFTLVASTEAAPPLDGERSLQERCRHDDALLQQWQAAQPHLADRAPAWVRQLVQAADQFVVARTGAGEGEAGQTLLAGYPWFGDWGRDTMISLSGLTLATGRPAIAARILRTYAAHLSAGMLPNRFPEGGEPLGEHDYNTVDATLWYVEALRRYHEATGDTALIRELFPHLRQIVEAHCRGTRHGIRRDPVDGLLSAGAEGLQLTWMDAKVNGEVITPRRGKPVEVNVLWYCALRCLARFAPLCGEAAEPYAALAEQARVGFQRFWNPQTGCCFDVLDGPGGNHEAAVRPNQLLAVALTDQLLSAQQARQLLEICGQRLLTPMGLRSLDLRDPRYVGHYGGGPVARDQAYHQGTVWGWWLGPWALAQARVQGSPQPALQWLEAIGDHLAAAGLGSVSEIFDGDPPHAPRGCIAQAWSVAEVLRAWTELSMMQVQAQAPEPR
ncbi:glycogen debranching enzyme family protein [Vulcanococcus limneticus Candia 3F8]|uniref:amylo-alpha-1,6-glucosidase n=1 Tax=Vulcanococcus limneticus TaxID=2170428 RepID=UPI000B996994|nr:amylo-alpha-1,6-glucosidase [Vulcanococcus limneticus]MCP9791869.1 glycogen debranching enzyme family protein [Vulcanococcus limneticus MW73D5]MCP9894367.1 glycogen debranching enzyme family protein [Vulcanococcus limneticus Candia 3F8]MCP9897325.1 glycogen debranching enzyme family protein [Vulcanococcus limneticus Candia 3B3]